MQEQSLCIKEPSPSFNQQNFDGRVFASTPHHSHQALFTSHHQYVPAATYYQSISPSVQPAPVYIMQNPSNSIPVHFNHSRMRAVSISHNNITTLAIQPPAPTQIEKPMPSIPQQSYNLYERSKSIDSIKVVAYEQAALEPVKVLPQSASKPSNTFPLQANKEPPIARREPLFTH